MQKEGEAYYSKIPMGNQEVQLQQQRKGILTLKKSHFSEYVYKRHCYLLQRSIWLHIEHAQSPGTAGKVVPQDRKATWDCVKDLHCSVGLQSYCKENIEEFENLILIPLTFIPLNFNTFNFHCNSCFSPILNSTLAAAFWADSRICSHVLCQRRGQGTHMCCLDMQIQICSTGNVSISLNALWKLSSFVDEILLHYSTAGKVVCIQWYVFKWN